MNKKSMYLIAIAIVIGLAVLIKTSIKDVAGNDQKENKPKPVNITVLLDLSDRLIRDNLNPSQPERDKAIVEYLVDKFVCMKNAVKSRNCMRVMFYPQPDISDIAVVASKLDVNLGKEKRENKGVVLKNMKHTFSDNISQIYSGTLGNKSWVGCDIWGFFSNKEVDRYCIMDGYRNILVILTDGYVFHKDNKIKDGDNYTYVLEQTLNNPNSGLIVKRNGLQDLEVLVLEVNPQNPTRNEQIHNILEDWFKNMGITNVEISNTAMPKNTEQVIDKFFGF